MARDFRPKSAREGKVAPRVKKLSPQEKPLRKAKKASDASQSSSDEDDEGLLKGIQAFGGDESDLALLSRIKGKGKSIEDEKEDPALSTEVLSFMKGLDFKSAGVEAPNFADVKTTKKSDINLENPEVKATEAAEKGQKMNKKLDPSKKAAKEANRTFIADKAKEERSTKSTQKTKTTKQVSIANDSNRASVPEESKSTLYPIKSSGFLLQPGARWNEIELPTMKLPNMGTPSTKDVETLQQRGTKLLEIEKALYAELTRSGKGLGPGMLSSSDARFISDLLGPGSKGGTLSDRVAALTLLAQSSPVHNVDAMETLLNMAGKKGREESGRATRALADWLASGGGLSQNKLRYLRDHPFTPQLVNLLRSDKSIDSKELEVAQAHLLLATFEDKLKRFYFQFLQILESQSHDTLPFVRKQAVTQIYLLLKEKSEQEQNLLRLLVNKLGDTDRAVASKASSSLLNILNIHPNMKSVVTNEVSNLILKPVSALESKGKARYNSHARYYGILTLNQTMLTNKDEAVSNRLVNLYFELFESVLIEMSTNAGGKEEEQVDGENGEKTTQQKQKKLKQRWRDGKGKKGAKKPNNVQQEESKVIQDADAKTMAAILTGLRRALPFAQVDGAVFEKHMTTLFRITHSSTFNISIQALQLIFQVNLSSIGASSSSSQAVSVSKVEDRFYRALYASLLDPRLATTSKQAMYLNLLFKAIKADNDSRRVKAFVKRFVQTLDHGEPPWICGGLFLLGELMIALPGLKTLLEEAEDDGDEHFVDAAEGSEEEGHHIITSIDGPAAKQAQEYDALKREPQFAHAETSCLWEIVPLLSHFHPSVSLHARQFLAGERITTSADLSLNTLAHFLDRFVYRNPKKNIAQSKGASMMQPAININEGKTGFESGVVKLKGVGIRQDEYFNNETFWKKKVQEIPVDHLFFHKYFTQKLRRSGEDISKKGESNRDKRDDEKADQEEEKEEDDDDDDDDDDDEASGDGDGESLDSEDEEEIWKEMKRTMPRIDGDEMLDEIDTDEDDEELMDYSDSNEDDVAEEKSEQESEEENPFDEDEEDLLPFGLEEEETSEDERRRGTKRTLDDEANHDGEDDNKEKSKSQLRREDRKRRKALPTFASAEDYAHLLGNSDDDEEVA